MTKHPRPRKRLRIEPAIEALEVRELLAASPVHAMRSFLARAELKPMLLMAPRLGRALAVVDASQKVPATHFPASPLVRRRPGPPSYDIAIHFSYVGSPGNASVAINGFVPPSRATVPAQVPNGGAYQNIGGVPYVYGIGQTEITAGQYVTFLNKVDPNGDNPVQPFTGIRLWVNAFSPVLNPFSGEINLVVNAAPGTHYQLAASYWA